MAVYTPVKREALQSLLRFYSLGELVALNPITEGVENTNYFVTTTRGEFVLTLFEGLRAEELPYFLNLMSFLAERGFPCASPIADRAGNLVSRLAGRPATFFQRLHGTSVSTPTQADCATVGHALAELHRHGLTYPGRRSDPRGTDWQSATASKLREHLAGDDVALLYDELEFQRAFPAARLPHGTIHGDLFRDNVLLKKGGLTGIIDFYYACNHALIYDLAITANDWCVQKDGGLDSHRLRALLIAYGRERPLLPSEANAWSRYLRAAALRFWISRLHDMTFPRPGSMTHEKDPNEIRRILSHRRDNQETLHEMWDELVSNEG